MIIINIIIITWLLTLIIIIIIILTWFLINIIDNVNIN